MNTFGSDFALWPRDCWDIRDRRLVSERNQPLGMTLPTPAPARSLQGFRLFPDQRAPETKGERAVREIRARLGSR